MKHAWNFRCSLLIAVLILVAACVPITQPAQPVAPKNNKVLLMPREVSANMELMLTKEVGVMVPMLEKAGYQVVVATASGKPLLDGKTTLAVDMKLADVNVNDYAGFLLPCMAAGGSGVPSEAVAIVQKAVATGKPVAAQQSARVILATAGVLKGRNVAIDAGVVQDGNLITSAVCPSRALETGLPDDTVELTQKFMAALAAHQ